MEFDGFDIRFSVVELCDYLMNNFKIPEETVHLLQVEQVDGRTLLDLNDDELQMVGFKTLGLRKSIQRLILQFNNVHDTMKIQRKCHFPDLTDLVAKDDAGKEALSQLG
ncbi:unnamed protein product [Clavelina lepadiformis]|uniref:SAM domain-containing protein n=1 Tax=Clavelina lepadiformis TaxID=159417 RepID=A0ABP0GGU7_CLALP